VIWEVQTMTTEIQQIIDEIEERDGLYIGQWRRPVNPHLHVKGSIHEDASAQRLGFRGGLITGAVHTELFPPLLLKAFGQRWFEHGDLSLYFVEATLDREEVRAIAAAPPAGAADVQVQVWGERPNGNRICEGTAAVGDPGEISALLARDLNRFPVGELHILAQASVGDQFPEIEVGVTQEEMDRRLEVTSDPLPWYRGDSPWGGAVATTATMVHALMQPCYAYLQGRRGEGIVGLFGAIELRNINGPVLVGRPYRAGGHLVNLGQTAKTEYLWFESYMDDEASRRTAEMRMMIRFMKASSPAYQQESGG
jgi:hypothetical protein